MGVNEWDEGTRGSSRAPRARRPGAYDAPPGRTLGRSMRDGPRGSGGQPERDERATPDARERVHGDYRDGYRDDTRDEYRSRPGNGPARPPYRGRDERGAAWDDEGRPASSGGRGRAPGPGMSTRGMRSPAPGGRGERPSREDYEAQETYRYERPPREPRDAEQMRPGDRSLRQGRGPMRDDTWAPTQRTRASEAGAPAGPRDRRMPRGEPQWEDDELPPRRRPEGRMDGRDGGDPRARSHGRPMPSDDPRLAARGRPRGASNAGAAEEEARAQGGCLRGVVKALGALVLALALGGAAGYLYFHFTTPKLTAPSASPSSTPTTAPSATASPHAEVMPPGATFVLVAASYSAEAE